MTSFNQKRCTTSIIYRDQIQTTDKINDQTNMHEIRQHVQKLLNSCLRNSYRIQAKNYISKQLIDLDQNMLKCLYNPFKIDSSVSNGCDNVELFVIDDLRVNSEINEQQSSIIGLGTKSFEANHTLTFMVNESECQQDLPVKDNTTDRSIAIVNDLSCVLLTNGPFGLTAYNDTINNRRSEDALIQNNLSISIQNSTTCPSTIESDPFYFSVDVKSVQKPIYMSDQFNKRDRNKITGDISHIQGTKEGKSAKSSVLPRIRIPRRHRNKLNAQLVIHAVYQKRLGNGKICWIKHRNKGFLPRNYTRDTIPVNPICFSLNNIPLSMEGDFNLPLKMTTKWDKSDALDEEVYQLDEQLANNLHPIMDLDTKTYDPFTPRLLASISENNCVLDNAVCLSDFMRSTYKKKT